MPDEEIDGELVVSKNLTLKKSPKRKISLIDYDRN